MARDLRAVLLGMNNPLSVKPEHALYPYPPGCTGHRIFTMLLVKMPDLLRHQYLDGFERVNLVDGKDFSMRLARQKAQEIVDKYQGRTVVVLGASTRAALKLPHKLILPMHRDGVIWRQLPHPSGRNRWYNDARNRELAASLLTELYLRGRGATDARDQST